MAVQEVTMYRVICDTDGCDKSPNDDTEYYAWAEKQQAIDEAGYANWWREDDGRVFCDQHQPRCSRCSGYLFQDDAQPDDNGGLLCEDCQPDDQAAAERVGAQQ